MDRNLRVAELGAPRTTTAAPRTTVAWPKALLKELLETVLPALLIAVAIVVFVVQPTRVEGSSMEPTLNTGERLVVEKISYRFRTPVAGEVVVLKVPGREESPLIKRVIATAGDVIAIRNGRVYLNGQALSEGYLMQVTVGELPATVVPEGYVFVLGDNRGSSNDSRTFGMIPLDHLVGRALISYWPLDRVGFIK